nr:sulfurtransferase TusA family protein [Massilibacterium senegalense]
MLSLKADQTLDCKGLSCPMPIVKTKKAIDAMPVGEVLEVQATDKGSLADLQAWAKRTGHNYLGTLEEGDVLKHYLRKCNVDGEREEMKFANTVQNDELKSKLGENIIVLDVREEAEYFFSHIPNAVSIPLGELEEKANDLDKENEIYVICRTGNRSDLACQQLDEKGFKHIFNVIPGMNEWDGPTESDKE